MTAWRAPLLRRFLPRTLCAAALLALLVIALSSSALGPAQRPITQRETPMPTSTTATTPTPSPTPSPTPTPDTPLVYLMAHGNLDRPEIALTFDDGPAPTYTQAILAVLRHYHIQATFFMLGIWVQRYPELARAVVADGHAIGDHTWNHLDLTTLSASQITQQLTNTRNIIQKVTGVVPTLFRPPYGSYTRQILDMAHALKFSTILWSVDPSDWARPGVNVIVNNILTYARNGSIILMHDGGGDRSETVAALSTIIEHLQARGFTFVTIPQMLLHLPPTTITEQP